MVTLGGTATGHPATASADVDLAAVRANTRALLAATGTPVMAVVKADGYGHGAVPMARAAVQGGATWLGVALLHEAAQLRAAGLAEPLLAWLFGPDEDLTDALRDRVDLGVYSLAELERAADAARALRVVGADAGPARVHLKVDTGLSRGGQPLEGWEDLCARAARLEGAGDVEVVGVWSHLACSDEPDHPANDAQVAAFETALAVASVAGLRPAVRHLANSAAALTAPRTRYDLVRCGVTLGGLSPVPRLASAPELGLRPAMTLRARVVHARRVPAGTGIGYGHHVTTDRATTLALVPLGYADGLPRAARGSGPVQVRTAAGAVRGVVTGTVSMDQVVVDLGDAEVAVGDEVVVFGAGDDGAPTAQEWAEALGTIGYEVVTRVGARVPRRHVGGGEQS